MNKKLKPLARPDCLHLEAAQGWLGLGDVVSAHEELELITPTWRAHPAVLLIRYEIYAKADKWDAAVEISNTLTKALPEDPGVWIWHAYATRRKTDGSVSEAKGILLEVEPKFPRDYLFPFNLACYCSQLGVFDEAEKWFKKAMGIDELTVKRIAVDDPDLRPLWDSMGGASWKRS